MSDYLLALRALLEGGGPAKAGLVARAAALVAGPAEREPERARIERAIALERNLMAGERVAPGSGSPLEAVGETEELLRTLLRGMATGELGSDLRLTADEILLADGLRVGEGSSEVQGGTAEWRVTAATDPIVDEETREWQIPDLEEAENRRRARRDQPTRPEEIAAPDMFGPEGGFNPRSVEAGSMEKPRKPAPPPWLDEETGSDLDWPSFAGPRPKAAIAASSSTSGSATSFPRSRTTTGPSASSATTAEIRCLARTRRRLRSSRAARRSPRTGSG